MHLTYAFMSSIIKLYLLCFSERLIGYYNKVQQECWHRKALTAHHVCDAPLSIYMARFL